MEALKGFPGIRENIVHQPPLFSESGALIRTDILPNLLLGIHCGSSANPDLRVHRGQNRVARVQKEISVYVRNPDNKGWQADGCRRFRNHWENPVSWRHVRLPAPEKFDWRAASANQPSHRPTDPVSSPQEIGQSANECA